MRVRTAIQIAVRSLLALITVTVAGLVLVAYPEPMFTHYRTLGQITFADSEPIPPEADHVLAEIAATLERGPFAIDRPLTLFVARGWRGQFYFNRARGAGGVVYYPITGRHAFLSGADYRAGRLLKGDQVIPPPRTLAYYGVHELTHVLSGNAIGWREFQDLPFWVREGLADYVALSGGARFVRDEGRVVAQGFNLGAVQAKVHGSYPLQRELVAWALEHEGWTIEELLQTRITGDEAEARMRSSGYMQ